VNDMAPLGTPLRLSVVGAGQSVPPTLWIPKVTWYFPGVGASRRPKLAARSHPGIVGSGGASPPDDPEEEDIGAGGVGVFVAVGAGVGVDVAVAVGDGVGVIVAVGDGVEVGTAVGDGDGVPGVRGDGRHAARAPRIRIHPRSENVPSGTS
jgi:hypothetical protein